MQDISHSSPGDMYSRLMAISQEALVSAHEETAYHALTAAMHLADDLGDDQRLLAVERAAKAQLDWIDAHNPENRMSSQSTAERKGVNLYYTLIKQAAAHALIARQERRRKHTHNLPWPGDAS